MPVAGEFTCGNEVFGDPMHGPKKECYCDLTPYWVQCAVEHADCKCDNGYVAYGADNNYVLKHVKSTIKCDNHNFGVDALHLTTKHCMCMQGRPIPHEFRYAPKYPAQDEPIGSE